MKKRKKYKLYMIHIPWSWIDTVVNIDTDGSKERLIELYKPYVLKRCKELEFKSKAARKAYISGYEDSFDKAYGLLSVIFFTEIHFATTKEKLVDKAINSLLKPYNDYPDFFGYFDKKERYEYFNHNAPCHHLYTGETLDIV